MEVLVFVACLIGYGCRLFIRSLANAAVICISATDMTLPVVSVSS